VEPSFVLYALLLQPGGCLRARIALFELVEPEQKKKRTTKHQRKAAPPHPCFIAPLMSPHMFGVLPKVILQGLDFGGAGSGANAFDTCLTASVVEHPQSVHAQP